MLKIEGRWEPVRRNQWFAAGRHSRFEHRYSTLFLRTPKTDEERLVEVHDYEGITGHIGLKLRIAANVIGGFG